jgi:hypothetical protein
MILPKKININSDGNVLELKEPIMSSLDVKKAVITGGKYVYTKSKTKKGSVIPVMEEQIKKMSITPTITLIY